MTKGPIKNMAASVRQRLMNISKATNRRFIDVLQHYALERWLFRLSQSNYCDQCFLKGALLFVVWKTPATRPTRDIDLLARMNNDLEFVRKVVAEICDVSVDDDGLIFDSASVATEQIAEDAVYEGVRARFQGKLGNARIAMQVDIGFSDVVTPAPARISYPTMLDQPTAELLAYNRETAIAEKFEAMVQLGELNSRMKDFFDIALLAESFEFEGNTLAKAIRATFDRRGTAIQSDPICFSDQFAHDPTKAAQWRAFMQRSQISESFSEFPVVVHQVRDFLRPLAAQMIDGHQSNWRWPVGGPWQDGEG